MTYLMLRRFESKIAILTKFRNKIFSMSRDSKHDLAYRDVARTGYKVVSKVVFC